jgi:hypothetical protein
MVAVVLQSTTKKEVVLTVTPAHVCLDFPVMNVRMHHRHRHATATHARTAVPAQTLQMVATPASVLSGGLA